MPHTFLTNPELTSAHIQITFIRLTLLNDKRPVRLANHHWRHNVISSRTNALQIKLSQSLVRSQRKLISVSPRGDSMLVSNYSDGHFSTIRLAL